MTTPLSDHPTSSKNPPSRPPLGIAPRWIVDEQRIGEIERAIRDYTTARLPIPADWLIELGALLLERVNANIVRLEFYPDATDKPPDE